MGIPPPRVVSWEVGVRRVCVCGVGQYWSCVLCLCFCVLLSRDYTSPLTVVGFCTSARPYLAGGCVVEGPSRRKQQQQQQQQNQQTLLLSLVGGADIHPLILKRQLHRSWTGSHQKIQKSIQKHRI